MDPRPSQPMLTAPGAGSAAPVHCPGTNERPGRLPRLNDHLLPEDSPYEILNGQRILRMAEPEHARPQTRIAAVLTALAAPGFEAMTELTTRADTAPPPADLDPNAAVLPATVQELRSDVCLLRAGKDPSTGDRFVEDISFEVANEQSLSRLRQKAALLHARGVRRVFGLLAKKGQVVEWSPQARDFLPVVGEIRDPSLHMPLSVRALLDAATAEETMARGLDQRGTPYLQQLRQHERQEGHKEGHKEGQRAGELRAKAASILEVLRARDLPLSEADAGRIRDCQDLALLSRWLLRAVTVTRAEAIFQDP